LFAIFGLYISYTYSVIGDCVTGSTESLFYLTHTIVHFPPLFQFAMSQVRHVLNQCIAVSCFYLPCLEA